MFLCEANVIELFPEFDHVQVLPCGLLGIFKRTFTQLEHRSILWLRQYGTHRVWTQRACEGPRTVSRSVIETPKPSVGVWLEWALS